MAERWDTARVLALAPDVSSRRAAGPLAAPGAWLTTGAAGTAVWGECQGSAARPYRTAADLAGPAYTCSCPSRKSPCKHALALLLLWACGQVAGGGEPPDWAAPRPAARRSREEPADPQAAQRRAAQRAARVAAGLDELDRWLADQVRQGLAHSPKASYLHWDTIAARMIDAQAPAIAERLRALPAVLHSGPGWESRLLEEYAMLRLLISAYRRRDQLPADLDGTVRSRIGFTTRHADVLARGEHVKDSWLVLARRDLELERIRTRRTWLRAGGSGRVALVLSFAGPGESFDLALPAGACAVLELAFYPGALPLRALIVTSENPHPAGPPPGTTAAGALNGWAHALAADPWLESWPVIITATPATEPRPCLADADGDALPLHPGAGDCWPLLAVSAGRPVTVAAEWSPRGLWPLTVWDEAGLAVPL